MEKKELFEHKQKCCACGACMNICPKNAIIMVEDACGFYYPQIDESLCINCGACKKVCNYQNTEPQNTPQEAYVAVNKKEEQLLKSASGGVFAAIATMILEQGGVVFGATLDFENGHAVPHHIGIESEEELYKLQGSKYVQSSIGDTYTKAKQFLLQGRKVLFSGTPCQIAGLYGYLKKDYENLFTIDVICHGVPSAKFFDDYIQIETKKRKLKFIDGYAFRDKKKGWGMNGRIDGWTQANKRKNIYVAARVNSYNTLFLDGASYRENCYSCKYATKKRVADMTIGDFWGVEVEHTELIGKNGYNEKNGISCIIVNTEKGKSLCNMMKSIVQMNHSTFEKVSNRNGQLKSPSTKASVRECVLNIYKEKGYYEVEKWFQKKYKKQIIVHTIYNMIPRKIRIVLKSMLKGKK